LNRCGSLSFAELIGLDVRMGRLLGGPRGVRLDGHDLIRPAIAEMRPMQANLERTQINLVELNRTGDD
jgi:hypothetical protein